MPCSHNRAAFKAATANTLPTLIRTYSGLVLLELALKESLGIANLGHDIPLMLQRLATKNRPQAAALNQQRSDITNKLIAIRTTRKDNSIAYVRSAAYPDLRYIRHSSDWKSDASTDKEIEDLRICIDRLRTFLKTNMGFAQPI